jgi:hypothetical protein
MSATVKTPKGDENRGQFAMTLKKQPSLDKDFEPTEVPSHGVSVLFKPTQTRYVFEVFNGSLLGSCIIDRQSTDLGGYDDSQVESYARRVAAIFAESVLKVA